MYKEVLLLVAASGTALLLGWMQLLSYKVRKNTLRGERKSRARFRGYVIRFNVFLVAMNVLLVLLYT